MNLKLEQFTEMETPEPVYGLSRKCAEIEYDIDDVLIPLELVLTEYAGDTEHGEYFSVDIKQGGRTWHGDEYETLEDAFLDAEYRILELFDSYEIGKGNVGETWEAV